MIPEFNTTKYDREYCALLTPYKTDSLEVDYEAFRKLVRYFTTDADFLKIGGSFIVNPEAGEMFYLTPKEREGLIKIVLEERHADMPIFSGCYGVRRDEVIDSALQSKSLGVDGLFVLPPTGFAEVSTGLDGSRNPEIWTNHVRTIAEATQLPLIIHASHPRTAAWGAGVPGETIQMVINEVPSVVGWKMIFGDVSAHFKAARLIRSLKRHVAILNTPSLCHHTAMLCDLVDGSVNGAFNYQKEGIVEHRLAWLKGDMESVKRIWNAQVMPIDEFTRSDRSRTHIVYKLLAWIRGRMPHPFMRPPMPPLRRDEAEKGFEMMLKTGLSCISRSEFDDTLSRQDSILSRY